MKCQEVLGAPVLATEYVLGLKTFVFEVILSRFATAMLKVTKISF